jgi:hypothetical protein
VSSLLVYLLLFSLVLIDLVLLLSWLQQLFFHGRRIIPFSLSLTFPYSFLLSFFFALLLRLFLDGRDPRGGNAGDGAVQN